MKYLLTMLLLAVMLPVSIYGQTVVQVPSDFTGEGNLNNAVQTAINSGTLSNTIFELEPFGYYILTGTIVVPVGQHLQIVAPKPGNTQTTAPPQIVWTASGGVTTDFNFEVYGSITMKNVWLRYANTAGVQIGSSLQIQNNPDPNAQETAYFEGVIFDYSQVPSNASGAVGITADHFVGTFKNCYFRNCTDVHFRYYGRALSFPFSTVGWHTDSVLFENCTFANIGYVYMQEGGEYGDNVHFNHCTFLNTVMFTLQSGWWWKMFVTNSIFVNPFMFGNIPAQTGDGDPNGSTVRIDSIASFNFQVPFTEQDRRILFANNSHYYEAWLVDWMANNPYSQFLRANRRDDEIPVPQPMLSPQTLEFFAANPFMNTANLYDNTNPAFLIPPTNEDSLKDFLRRKWEDNTDIEWSYNSNSGWYQTWPLPENLSYTNTTLKTAAMGGFSLGDLYHWWPDQYTAWKAQSEAEYERIFTWLETGNDPATTAIEPISGSVPANFTLSQNYPNPFNPTTQIKYSVPRASQVSLKVYNTLGQEVATIFEGAQQAGNYLVTFDGSGLTSGVYLYKLQSGSVSIARKFILMK
jgi:hypothetical protein